MTSNERPTLTAEERAIDRPRSDAFYLLKGAVIGIQRPGMAVEDVDHAIETLRRALTKLEEYGDALDAADASE